MSAATLPTESRPLTADAASKVHLPDATRQPPCVANHLGERHTGAQAK